MSPPDSRKDYSDILRKYPYSEYLNVPKSYQLISEATVLNSLLTASLDFELAGHINDEYLREYLKSNVEFRNVFKKCWQSGDFNRFFALNELSTMVGNSSRTFHLSIHGGSFKEIHGDSYEITIGEDEQTIMNWLSQIDYIPLQREIYRRRAEDTGNWFLESPEFGKWVRREGGRILWCPGIPGAGKTTMASIVVSHLQEVQRGTVLFVYFDYKRQKDQNVSFVIGGLARQMYELFPCIRGVFKCAYEDHKRRHLPEKQLIDLLKRVIRTASKEPTFIVIDALDEYLESYRDAIAFHLLDLITSLNDNIQVMVTSRVLGEMEAMFKSRDATRFEIVGTDADITRYIQSRVLEEIPFAKRILRDLIRAVLSTSQHRFIQAKLQMDHLCSMPSTGDIRESLFRLSSDIDDAYTLVFERINEQAKPRREIAHRALAWVALSFGPLTEKQLQEALATTRGRTHFELQDYMPSGDYITAACAGLIAIEQESRTVKFIHLTVYEYFQRNPDQMLFGHSFLARTCMNHITTKHHQMYSKKIWANPRKNMFLGYALHFWGHHCSMDEEVILKDILEFLGPGEQVIQPIIESIFQRPHDPWKARFVESMTGIPLHVAAYFCLPKTLAFYIEAGVPINGQTTGNMLTPLAIAVTYGTLNIVQILLDSTGIDVNLGAMQGITPITMASQRGDLSIVEALLQHSNLRRSSSASSISSALIRASANGCQLVVKRLLDAGVDNDYMHDALNVAIGHAHVSTVDTLLNFGANPMESKNTDLLPLNQLFGKPGSECLSSSQSTVISKVIKLYPEAGTLRDEFGLSLLGKAVLKGDHSMVKLLVTSGLIAQDDLQGLGGFAVPLMGSALLGGNLIIIEMIFAYLLQQNDGVYKEIKYEGGRTDLSYAAEAGLVDFVKTLIETWNVEVDATDEWGRSPLSRAASYARRDDNRTGWDNGDCVATVEYLIGLGAKYDRRDDQGGTPLAYAAAAHNSDIIQLLIDKGVDLNTLDVDSRTPLSYAVTSGCIDVVQLLLGNGADPNLADNSGCVPLSYLGSTMKSNQNLPVQWPEDLGMYTICQCDMARLLLEYGAEVDKPDNAGRTPLSYAASGRGSSQLLSILVSHGANIDSVDADGRTPLSHAAGTDNQPFSVHLNIIYLLDKGADISIRDIRGKSALDYAKGEGFFRELWVKAIEARVIDLELPFGSDFIDWNLSV